jgi:hypothetical protein
MVMPSGLSTVTSVAKLSIDPNCKAVQRDGLVSGSSAATLNQGYHLNTRYGRLGALLRRRGRGPLIPPLRPVSWLSVPAFGGTYPASSSTLRTAASDKPKCLAT